MILLPVVLPPDFKHDVLTVDRFADGYKVTIGVIPRCHGWTVCADATVEGTSGKADHFGRRPVRLRNGITAWYEDHACGANCAGSATLVFEKAGMTCTISIKAGTLPQVLGVANGLQNRR